MNYRRGLQRVFAVLAVAWVVVVFSTVFSDNWKPWERDQQGWWQATVGTGPADGLSAAYRNAIEIQLSHNLRVMKWSWALSLSLLPPVALYFLLFYISRWIYSGFKPARQI